MLITTNRGRVLRFENFYSTSAPDVHVRLAFDPQSNDTYDLGPIRATSGNVNYMLPAGVDIRRYRYVLIWSEPFRLLLGSAELK